MFNHSPRVRKIAISVFFKSKPRHFLNGFDAGSRRGCHRDASHSSEQSSGRRDWFVKRIADKLSLNAEQKPLLAILINQATAQNCSISRKLGGAMAYSVPCTIRFRA